MQWTDCCSRSRYRSRYSLPVNAIQLHVARCLSLLLLLLFIGDCKNLATASNVPDIGAEAGVASLPSDGGGRNTYVNIDSASDDDDTKTETNPREVQKAVCTVTAGEVRASAEAVTTKTLKGVCGTAEMNLALRNLELKLYKELEEIKTMLRQMQVGAGVYSPFISKNDAIPSPSIFQPISERNDQTTFTTTEAPVHHSSNNKNPTLPKLKSLHSSGNGSTASSPSRELEVAKFNNTMLSDKDFKIFTYYWKLENFSQRFKDNGSTVESPIFSIKGKPLRIKASFNNLRRDFVHLQLEYAAINEGSSRSDKYENNIILDMGGLFKKIIDDEVPFKHKIAILDKNNRSNDLISQEFSNLDNGFLIPISALVLSPYAINNSLLIQVIFYL